MHTVYIPFVRTSIPSLRDLFAEIGVRFGMACEASSFDSAVQAPLIEKHCAVVVPEVSGKMGYTQPTRGVWDFSLMDALVERAHEKGLQVFGHTAMWHLQNPAWLYPTLQTITRDEGYGILQDHIRKYMAHFRGKLVGVDVVNELGAVMDGYGWAQYLGMGCVTAAIIAARQVAPETPIYYNSFYDSDEDARLAIDLLPTVDGIGIQLHLNTALDNTLKWERIRKILQACKDAGKPARFSEVSVYDPSGNMDAIANLYGSTIYLLKEWVGTVTDYVTWGVKYPAWNGRHVLFDGQGKPTKAYYEVVNGLVVT